MVLVGEGKFDMFYMTRLRAKQETQSDNGGEVSVFLGWVWHCSPAKETLFWEDYFGLPWWWWWQLGDTLGIRLIAPSARTYPHSFLFEFACQWWRWWLTMVVIMMMIMSMIIMIIIMIIIDDNGDMTTWITVFHHKIYVFLYFCISYFGFWGSPTAR